MKFVADENMDAPIVERLRQDGHAILYVAEMSPGIDDDNERIKKIFNRSQQSI